MHRPTSPGTSPAASAYLGVVASHALEIAGERETTAEPQLAARERPDVVEELADEHAAVWRATPADLPALGRPPASSDSSRTTARRGS